MSVVILYSVVIVVLSETEYYNIMVRVTFLFADFPAFSAVSSWLFTIVRSMLLLPLLFWKVVSSLPSFMIYRFLL